MRTADHLDLGSLFAPREGTAAGNTFVLKVRGDSMIDDHIADGDFVICEKRNAVRNGDTVVALLDTGEATLKRFYKEKGGMIRLQPANEKYEARLCHPDEVQIQGMVIGVVRTY